MSKAEGKEIISLVPTLRVGKYFGRYALVVLLQLVAEPTACSNQEPET